MTRFTRRQFAKLSAAAAVASRLPFARTQAAQIPEQQSGEHAIAFKIIGA
ncbi:MAG: hypothetical protein ABSG84_18650 [Acidobacteriaceae bacterium]|jgi:hypothetical protein